MQSKITTAAIAGVEKVRVPVQNLAIGMFVMELDRPWLDTPFLVQGFTLRSQKDVDTIREYCRFVYVDITRGLSQTNNSGSKPKETIDYRTTRGFADSLDAAIPIHAEATNAVGEMFNSLRLGAALNTEALKPVVESCVENIVANPDAMLWLTMIKDKDNYTAEHSLNVCILSIALGRAEGLLPLELENLGLCALLHDIGKVKIPEGVLNKEGSLDAKEFDVMKMHTVHGKKILLSQQKVPTAAVDVALSHHERLDGTGYPRGLPAEKIPYYVRLVAIVDAYDAMTSGRIYSAALPPADAMKRLLDAKGSQVDEKLMEKFLDCMGLYPIGSIAELTSGELGIVLPSAVDNKLQPRVLVTRDSEKIACRERIVDLAKGGKTSGGKPLFIRALHPDGYTEIFLRDYREAGLRLTP